MNFCKLKNIHLEFLDHIRSLQCELKELEQKYAKANNETDVFIASRKRVKSSFFTKNLAKYFEHNALDRDFMILQRALENKLQLDESSDWRLQNVIEEDKHGIVDPLHVQ